MVHGLCVKAWNSTWVPAPEGRNLHRVMPSMFEQYFRITCARDGPIIVNQHQLGTLNFPLSCCHPYAYVPCCYENASGETCGKHARRWGGQVGEVESVMIFRYTNTGDNLYLEELIGTSKV